MGVNVTEERLVLSAVDQTSAVVGKVTGSLTSMKTGLDTVQGALSSVGLTVGAGAMLALYGQIVKNTAALDDMAESTGASVENLSKLQAVAKIGGHEFDGLTATIGKMIRGLKAGDDGSRQSAAALEFLGVKAKDTNGIFRDSGEILIEVSKKLSQYQDGGNKVALVQDLLGKGAERYLPFLKDLAEEGDIQAKVTARRAAEAEKLEKNINRLRVAMEDTSRAIAGSVTETMNLFIERLVEAQQKGHLFFQTFVEGAKFMAAAASLFTFGKSGGMVDSAVEAIFNWDEHQRTLRVGPNLWPGAAAAGSAPGNIQNNYRSPGDDDKPKASTGKTYLDLLNEASGLDKDYYKDLQLLFTAYQQGKISVDKYADAVGALTEKQKFARDLAQNDATIRKAQAQAAEEYAKTNDKQLDTMTEVNNAAYVMLQQLEQERDLVGRNATEIEKANAFRQLDAQLRQASNVLSDEQMTQLRGEIALRKELIGTVIEEKQRRLATQKAVEDAEKSRVEAAKQANESIARGLTDALMRGFENGKGFAKNFWSSMVNMAKTVVLEPVIRFLISPLSNAMSSAVGTAFGGAVGGGGGASGLMSLFGSGFGGSQAIADIGNFFGSIGSVTEAGTTFGLMDAIGGFAAANPWVAGGIAAASLLGLGGLFGEDGPSHPAPQIGLFGPGETQGQAAAQYQDKFKFAGGFYDAGALQKLDAANALLNDPTQYDPAVLARMTRSAGGTMLTGGQDDTTEQMLQRIFAYLEPAHLAAQQNTAEAAQAQQDAADAADAAAQALEEAAKQLATLVDQEKTLSGSLQSAVESLPHQLGIDTLQAALDSLAVSDTVGPTDRLAAAQSIYDRTLAQARAGDLGAVNALPDAVQSLLGIGRDVYASGPQFQALFSEANRALGEVLSRQQGIQTDILASVPVAIQQAAADQIGVLQAGFTAMVTELAGLRTEIRRLQAA